MCNGTMCNGAFPRQAEEETQEEPGPEPGPWMRDPDAQLTPFEEVCMVTRCISRLANRARDVVRRLNPARSMLHEAMALLRESSNASDYLFNDAIAVVQPGLESPLTEVSINAAASLASGLFDVPLAVAVLDAVTRVQDVCRDSSKLENPLSDVRTLIEHQEKFAAVFACNRWRHIGVDPCDAKWWTWRRHLLNATIAVQEAHLTLSTAVMQAEEALVVVKSPLRGRHGEEADVVVQYAIYYLERAMNSLLLMADRVDREREAIYDFMDTHP